MRAADLRTTVHPVHVSDPVRRVHERLRTNCARARSFTVALRPARVKAFDCDIKDERSEGRPAVGTLADQLVGG